MPRNLLPWSQCEDTGLCMRIRHDRLDVLHNVVLFLVWHNRVCLQVIRSELGSHSGLMCAALITSAHLGMSVRIRAANSSGVLRTESKPSAASFSAASACFMALAISR